MSELRIDPITGNQVLIAEHRAARPNDFGSAGETCPFCAGNEHRVPPPLVELFDASGDWQVRVVPNKFPAVGEDASVATAIETDSLFAAPQPALGAHEVVIESPRHLSDLTDLSVDELTQILRVFRDRLRYWADEGKMRYGIVFKNLGFAAGASLEHLHSQLMALPFVPLAIEAELRGARQFFEQHQTCIFCQFLNEERRHGERLVADEGGFVAICPIAARQPFETWILPSAHSARYDQSTNEQLTSLAHLLHQTIARLRPLIAPLSYNLILHTAPFDEAHQDHFHWHWELIPRTSRLAGLEWGAGVYVNTLAPERGALLLREG